eukprot:gnl/TRDRNA2_/TRDRNA2_90987_c0_seq1.p1 gnl/TRDRNA2_/TRDRNA2_90987_c0~~gnl/TRDRNA2_/TRDRNA2_90987_c0_seq1.p1  ORF type:complete len:930 (-),score=124.10 gnl/TRDRNA2_/TRDRNA2_90987_c0_seq1:66-2855(-)
MKVHPVDDEESQKPLPQNGASNSSKQFEDTPVPPKKQSGALFHRPSGTNVSTIATHCKDAAAETAKKQADNAKKQSDHAKEIAKKKADKAAEKAKKAQENSKELADRAKNKVEEAKGALNRILLNSKSALEKPPQVACFFEDHWQSEWIEQRAKVLCKATLDFHDEPRHLIIMQARPTVPAADETNAQILVRLHELDAEQSEHQRGCKPKAGPLCWPLHTPDAAAYVRHCEAIGQLPQASEDNKLSRVKARIIKALYTLRILRPSESSAFLTLLRHHYGSSVAFSFSWAYFLCQQLWIVLFLCVVFLFVEIANGTPFSVLHMVPDPRDKDRRQWWDVLNVAIVFWGAFVGCYGWYLYMPHTFVPAQEDIPPPSIIMAKFRTETEGATANKPKSKWAMRLKLLVIAFPLLAIFTVVIFAGLAGCTQLILIIIYDWGGCIEKMQRNHDPSYFCRDAIEEHGIFGWAAEVGVDILLVILFEAFFGLGQNLAEFISGLMDYKDDFERMFFVGMLTVSLSAIEKLGFVGTLAFAFVPAWENDDECKKFRFGLHLRELDCLGSPACNALETEITERLTQLCTETAYVMFKCDQYMFGRADPRCLSQEVMLEDRRKIFEKLLKGPFIVAPFIAMLMKVIVPWVAYRLDKFTRENKSKSCCCEYVARPLFRFLGLIFTYDCDSVGCCDYVKKGWPFSNVKITHWSQDALRTTADTANHVDSTAAPDVGEPYSPSYELQEADASPSSDVEIADVPQHGAPANPNTTAALITAEAMTPEMHEEAMRLCTGSLVQVSHKIFEPFGECQEMMLSFLWVLFFSPVMPFGVVITWSARLLEIYFDLTKLLHVRQRAFPENCETMRRLQSVFVMAATWASVGWTFGLSYITYNDDFWASEYRYAYLWGVMGWMLLGIVGALFYNDWRAHVQKSAAAVAWLSKPL